MTDEHESEGDTGSSSPATDSRKFAGVVSWLTLAKVMASASGFVTGPLLARALGATGRGDLSAIQVPFLIGPAIIGLGIPVFAYHELPRGRRPEEVLASLGAPLVVLGLLAAAAAVPAADALAGSRETVRTYLTVGFMLMPVMLIGVLLADALAALQRWRAVAATIILPFLPPLFGTVALYVLGDLTLGWAAALTIGGSLLAILPAIPMLVEHPPFAFSWSLARQGIAFGTKAWAGGLAMLVNLRLDQMLMITFVAPRVLGLYAVATTLSGAATLATGALAQPVMARIARGERLLLARAVRMSLLVTVILNGLLALLTPLLLTTLFGPAFAPAVPIALVLLIGAVPYSTGFVLSSALQADGAPLIPSLGELLAVVITVCGLLLLLKPLGGMGAAIVSDVAYSTSFGYQVLRARRRLGVSLGAFLVPTRGDVIGAVRLLPGLSNRVRLAA